MEYPLDFKCRVVILPVSILENCDMVRADPPQSGKLKPYKKPNWKDPEPNFSGSSDTMVYDSAEAAALDAAQKQAAAMEEALEEAKK
jgi:hypothetical protein